MTNKHSPEKPSLSPEKSTHDIQFYPIPAFQDNYLWLIWQPSSKQAYIVDPGCAKSALNALEERELNLKGILITHHHPDHIGGIETLVNTFHCPVWGPKNESIPCCTTKLQEGDKVTLTFEDNITQEWVVMDVPGHTQGHIAYFLKSANESPKSNEPSKLLCGDTLFSAGCGRLLGGTAEQLHHSLQRIANLPDNTVVFCTHEYTQANLAFARAADPNNSTIINHQEHVQKIRSQNQPTLPTTIGQEKQLNPFLRCDQPSIQQQIHQQPEIQTINNPTTADYFAALRQWKDRF